MLVVFQNVGIEGIGIFERFFDIAIQYSRSDSCNIVSMPIEIWASTLTLSMNCILILLDFEPMYHGVRIQAQRFVFCVDLPRKCFRCLDVPIVGKKLKDLRQLVL